MAFQKLGVVFGLNYPGTSNELRGCVSDAEFWSGMMDVQSKAGHKDWTWAKAYTDFTHYTKLLNHECTRKNMETALISELSRAKENDYFVITYSGHGTIVPPGMQSWVPHDFDWHRPKTWFTYHDLDHLLMEHEKRGVVVVVISDSCHSRANPLLNFRKFNPHPTLYRYIEPPPDIESRIVAQPFNQNVLTSNQDDLMLAGCQKTETSADAWIAGKYQGAFTYALSRAMRQRANLSYQEIVLRARAWLAQSGYSQTPSADGSPAFLRLPFFRHPSEIREG